MSTYNLNTLNRNRFFEEAEQTLMDSFKKNYFYKHYKIGDGKEDLDKIEHAINMRRIMCSSNCEIINYIQDKIEGKLIGTKKKKNSLLEVIDISNLAKYPTIQNNNHFNTTMFWTEVSW